MAVPGRPAVRALMKDGESPPRLRDPFEGADRVRSNHAIRINEHSLSLAHLRVVRVRRDENSGPLADCALGRRQLCTGGSQVRACIFMALVQMIQLFLARAGLADQLIDLSP